MRPRLSTFTVAKYLSYVALLFCTALQSNNSVALAGTDGHSEEVEASLAHGAHRTLQALSPSAKNAMVANRCVFIMATGRSVDSAKPHESRPQTPLTVAAHIVDRSRSRQLCVPVRTSGSFWPQKTPVCIHMLSALLSRHARRRAAMPAIQGRPCSLHTCTQAQKRKALHTSTQAQGTKALLRSAQFQDSCHTTVCKRLARPGHPLPQVTWPCVRVQERLNCAGGRAEPDTRVPNTRGAGCVVLQLL